MGINPEKLKLGMIENIEYPNNYFDFISSGAVIEHLYDPSNFIIKAMKLLKPNGVIHIEVPSSKWLMNRIVTIYFKLTGNDYVANLSPMYNPFHLYEFGLESFQKHAKQNNYLLAHHEYMVCPTFMPKVADLFLRPYMKMTNTGMQLTV